MTEELKHEEGENEKNCWCKPDMILELHGRELWVHKGPSDELPPAKIIANAVYDLMANI